MKVVHNKYQEQGWVTDRSLRDPIKHFRTAGCLTSSDGKLYVWILHIKTGNFFTANCTAEGMIVNGVRGKSRRRASPGVCAWLPWWQVQTGQRRFFSSWPVFPFDGKTRSGSRRRAADRLGGATLLAHLLILAARIIPFALCLASGVRGRKNLAVWIEH